MIIEMFVLAMLARFAYRRPEPDSEMTIIRNGAPGQSGKDSNIDDESNTHVVTVGYYRSYDKQKNALVDENAGI